MRRLPGHKDGLRSRFPSGRVLLAPTLLAAILVADSSEAQEQQGRQAQATRDSVDLVFEREVFTYPSFTRRNPFRPLTSGPDSGPQFEELSLIGVIYSTEPGASVALLAQGNVAAGGAGGRTFRVRRGTVLANMRVLEVQRDQVVVEVEEFGTREQRVLTLRRGLYIDEGAFPGPGDTLPDPPVQGDTIQGGAQDDAQGDPA
ncbi:MAG: hypothetical protein WEA09_15250 [Gemmatimonadota bacterium]